MSPHPSNRPAVDSPPDASAKRCHAAGLAERQRPGGAFLVRHHIETLTAFLVLIVLLTGLVPFQTDAEANAGGSRAFFRFDGSSFTLTDIVSNIFLYIPVGILSYWSAVRALSNGFTAVLVSLGLSAALSGGIEWTQAYLPARISSITDLVSNVTGAGLGVGIAAVGRLLGPRFLSAAIAEFRQQPLAAAIKAYCCVLFLMVVIPFTFSLDPGLLKRSLKTVHYAPFESVRTHHLAAETALSAGNNRQYVDATWRAQRCWARWAAEAASFMVLAWLLLTFLRDGYGFGRTAAAALTVWFSGLLAVALSVVQIPLLTRSTDVTDVLFRLVGVALGLVGRSFYLRGSTRIAVQERPARLRRLALCGCAVVSLYIMVTGLMPFVFDAGRAGPRASLASSYLLPFVGTFETRFDLMITGFVEKLTAWFLFAVLLVSCSRRLQSCSVGRRILYVTISGIGIATAIEIGQMFILVRITSTTDLILASVGCVAGVVIREQIIAFCHYAMTGTERGGAIGPVDAEASTTLTATDALISTLFDPHPDAPIESAPEKSPVPRSENAD